MRRMPILLCLLLIACESPAPEFMGATRHRVQVEGIDFVVFQKGEEAEVLRMGYLSKAERAPVQGLMLRAAEMATGCAALPDSLSTRIPGDTGEARVRLRCR